MGIKQIASGDHGHGETEAARRHLRRLYVNPASLRRAIARVVNATFAERSPELWGEGTACASDSRKFGAWESNLMTQWHNRYRGPGVMVFCTSSAAGRVSTANSRPVRPVRWRP